MKYLPKHTEPKALVASTESKVVDIKYSIDELFRQLRDDDLDKIKFLQLVKALTHLGYKTAIIPPRGRRSIVVMAKSTVTRKVWVNPDLARCISDEQQQILRLLNALPREGCGRIRRQLWDKYMEMK